LAGIPRAIAQRPLLLGALALAATLGAEAPAGAAAPDPLGALPAQVAEPVDAAVDALPSAPAPVPVQPAGDAAPPAPDVVRHGVQAAARPVQSARDAGGPAAGGSNPVGSGAAPLAPDPVRAVGTAASDLARRTPIGPVAGDPRPAARLDGLLRSIGDTLRSIVPGDSVAGPLLRGGALGQLTRSVLGGLSAPSMQVLAGLVRSPAGHDLLGTPAAEVRGAAAPPPGFGYFQTASAGPPAAEVGGRPGSPSPSKAPAPAAGGTAAPASGGLLFVPFLALLALAALAAPRLLRRLDATPAALRPALFVCALERPG
jgi:hypothetical protein